MTPLENQFPPRDRGDHPPTGKRRAFGKGPRPDATQSAQPTSLV
jgi:hypothetical protein